MTKDHNCFLLRKLFFFLPVLILNTKQRALYLLQAPIMSGSAAALLGADQSPWEPTKGPGSQPRRWEPTKAAGSQPRPLGANRGRWEPTNQGSWEPNKAPGSQPRPLEAGAKQLFLQDIYDGYARQWRICCLTRIHGIAEVKGPLSPHQISP